MRSNPEATSDKIVSQVIVSPLLQLLTAAHVGEREQEENQRRGNVDQIVHCPLPKCDTLLLVSRESDG